jgi:voltage-gated potassium channel
MVSPSADYVPAEGDVLLIFGSEAQIESLEAQFRQL